MKMGELYSLMIEKLSTIYSGVEAEIIANWTFEHFTGLSKMEMRLNKEKELTIEQNAQLNKVLDELLQHKPIQYVLGEAWFYGMKFMVDESVLIPRPETEELVGWILEIRNEKYQIRNKKVEKREGNASANSYLQILDIGTGSGCIPISLKKKIQNAEITSIDVSDKALAIAQQNATYLNAAIQLIELDFLEENNWNKLANYDIIVSNPPYIPIKEKTILDKNVTDWEPSLALFVTNNDPLIFYRKIALFAKTHLNKNGCLFLEIHQNYGTQTKNLLQEQGFLIELKKDINGNNRMIKASYEFENKFKNLA